MSGDEESIKLFGYGVFTGNKVPPEHAGGFGKAMHEVGATNPCLLLDSGKEVFGCECWWGPEESIKKMIGDKKVVEVDIDEERGRSNGHK